jgi:hypothetical protein
MFFDTLTFCFLVWKLNMGFLLYNIWTYWPYKKFESDRRTFKSVNLIVVVKEKRGDSRQERCSGFCSGRRREKLQHLLRVYNLLYNLLPLQNTVCICGATLRNSRQTPKKHQETSLNFSKIDANLMNHWWDWCIMMTIILLQDNLYANNNKL